MKHTRYHAPRNITGAQQRPEDPYGGELERIGSKIRPQPNGCWLYRGQADRYHRRKRDGGAAIQVHRLVYEVLVAPIPDGMHLHHTCLTPGCVNPQHLVPLTPSEHKKTHLEMQRAQSTVE